jgi:hypothetical protein
MTTYWWQLLWVSNEDQSDMGEDQGISMGSFADGQLGHHAIQVAGKQLGEFIRKLHLQPEGGGN